MSWMFMSSITFVKMRERVAWKRVTWENFLEALGERFGWVLA